MTGHRWKDAVLAFFRTFQKGNSAPTTGPIRLLELWLSTISRELGRGASVGSRHKNPGLDRKLNQLGGCPQA